MAPPPSLTPRRAAARQPTDDTAPVLVAGGSLVGLSTAVFLGWHGIPATVVERHRGTAVHPRAASFHRRTIELYRGVGMEAEIAEASRKEFVQGGGTVSVESLAGRELEWYRRGTNQRADGLSPSAPLFITQIGLEPILRRRAEELGARMMYGTEIVGVEADDAGVTVTVHERDSGRRRRLRAAYLVAADGARSAIREGLRMPLLGRGSFSRSVTIYFRADVTPLLRDRVVNVVYVFNPRLRGFLRFSLDGRTGFLAVNSIVDEHGRRRRDLAGDLDEKGGVELVRHALGDPNIEVEVENVQQWDAAASYAGRFHQGRVFLAGDSAHVMPPTGGFGGNIGVHDAHNLAWKLALVLDDVAGADLLSTYDAERRPVAAFTVEQAFSRYVARLDPELHAEDLAPVIDDAIVDLGYRYRSPAVLLGRDDQAGTGEMPIEDPWTPSGRPGTRAPHVTVTRNGAPLSTLDLMGRDFVLLAGPGGESWCRAARTAAARLSLPLTPYRTGESGDLEVPSDPTGDVSWEATTLAQAYGLEATGAVLVRPDGFIAWRAPTAGSGEAQSQEDRLVRALRRLIARPG